jgi:uracil-DNA glycosylase
MSSQFDTLHSQMLNCGSCDLCHERNQIVFGEGSQTPSILIIGEAPGEEEDTKGVPFVGKAGKKLDGILEYIGVTRDEIFITNAVLCRPPNNRNPKPDELDACKWRLDLQVQLLRPKLIIILGRVAMQQLSGRPIKGAMSQFFPENVKDGWLHYRTGEHESLVLVTYHPSYHLRSPERAYKTTLPHWKQVKNWVRDES